MAIHAVLGGKRKGLEHDTIPCPRIVTQKDEESETTTLLCVYAKYGILKRVKAVRQ